MHVIMPVVGEGRRFKEADFPTDKPFIRIQGKTMIEWALDPLPSTWMTWVICRSYHRYAFQAALATIRNVDIHTLPGPTDGAAISVLSALVGLPLDEPVAIINCDQWFSLTDTMIDGHGVPRENTKITLDHLQKKAIAGEWDGYILTFKGEGNRWSYIKEDNHGWIEKVAEKEPISDKATVGFYWFRRARDLRWAICNMVAHHARAQGEYYLAPAYNELIWECRKKIKAVPVERFVSLGTPEDVRRFNVTGAPNGVEIK